MVVFAYGSSQSKVDHIGKKVNEDFKHLRKINMINSACFSVSFWQYWYLEEHGKWDAKEEGQNAPKRTPERPTIVETWIISLWLVDRFLVQRVEEYLGIFVIPSSSKVCHVSQKSSLQNLSKIIFIDWDCCLKTD